MPRSLLGLVANFGKRFMKTRRPAQRSKTANFQPRLENLEAREVMTTAGWKVGLPPAQMTFSTHTTISLDANTASKTISSLTVKDNVTRAVVFTAPTSGDYLIKTGKAPGHSSFDTVLGVYDVSGNRLAFNDDAPGSRFSSLHVDLIAGEKYEIGVGHYRGTARVDTLSRYCSVAIDGPDRVLPPVVLPPVVLPPVVVAPAVDLGQNLVDWIHARLGQTVGNGECAGLADEALKAIGAKTFNQLGPVGADADYVWGTKVFQFQAGGNVSLFDQLKPGDIIQFRDVVLRHETPTSFSESRMPHHTAIVEANLGGGNLRILEQNANGVRAVTESTLSFADMNAGTVWIYRPISA